MSRELSPSLLLSAYAQGIFPMGDEDGELYWYTADPRAIIEPEHLHVSRSLRLLCRQGRFRVTVNVAFEDVIAGCADRPEGTWISDDIHDAYVALHERGYAHSVESWADAQLAGGIYGVAIGGAFFGESMFHRVSNASKVALVSLVQRLRDRGFLFLDIQFATPHLKRFGCIEIPRAEYLRRLDMALKMRCTFVD